jgi:hypothetical protein
MVRLRRLAIMARMPLFEAARVAWFAHMDESKLRNHRSPRPRIPVASKAACAIEVRSALNHSRRKHVP